MRVLIACEFSGIVRDAFRKRGHEAVSCDYLPSERKGPHIEGDVRDTLRWECDHFDLLIAFPPCTHLAVSGARWFKDKQREQADALAFARWLIDFQHIERVAVENPIGILSTRVRKPDQIIQPWQFGHGETKATCLWLKGLPKLTPTSIVNGREGRVWKEPPSPERWKRSSKTYQGIADARAAQGGAP